MPRAPASQNLHVHYCLCGEFLLVLDAPLAALARRPADGALVLPNSGPAQRVYKLNASEVGKDLVKPDTKGKKGEADAVGGAQVGAAGKEGNGVLVNREGGFEFQRASHTFLFLRYSLCRRRPLIDDLELLAGRLFCPRCQLQVGYETRPGEGQRGPATFILPGASASRSSASQPRMDRCADACRRRRTSRRPLERAEPGAGGCVRPAGRHRGGSCGRKCGAGEQGGSRGGRSGGGMRRCARRDRAGAS